MTETPEVGRPDSLLHKVVFSLDYFIFISFFVSLWAQSSRGSGIGECPVSTWLDISVGGSVRTQARNQRALRLIGLHLPLVLFLIFIELFYDGILGVPQFYKKLHNY